jgi:hypothetical protein
MHKVITGRVQKRERSLSVPEKHQLRIARDSMNMNCVGVAVMGGPNHQQAVSIIHQLTGAIAGINFDCTC